jgi:hypothetical protein
MAGARSHSNKIAQEVITKYLESIEGTDFKSEDIVPILNQNRARGYTAGRVGCLLKCREDVEWISDGRWRKINP